MSETSAMNSVNKVEQAEVTVEKDIKKEVIVKTEPHECLVCVNRSHECFDVNVTKTSTSGSSIYTFLGKFTQTELGNIQNCSKFICKHCYELINVLEHAELEYIKLKETFEAIISKNPLFETSLSQPLKLTSVKAEFFPDDDDDDESVHFGNLDEDSEDEPLVRNKRKRRKTQTKKKKSSSTGKRKLLNKNVDDRWECDICGSQGDSGGSVAETAHKLSMHAIDEVSPDIKDVKTEDSADGSQSPYNNGFESCIRVEFDNFDDDSSSVPESKVKSEKKRKLSSPRKQKLLPVQKSMKKQKVMHQCDECDSRYSTLSRLEQHKLKHDGSKPPYICEICGAHYKHKKACDIHIALHKGIGDWKCEECNRLFPSKNALQRHNNIHTGKLNYQCDLCGKSFIHTSSFKMHKLAHSGVKPHSCDVCGLALMTRSHLKRHKRIHSGEKRHECPICGKRFSERYNLAAHSKSHQQNEETLQPRELNKRRFFRCNFCPERFERRYMLERHTSVAHGRTLERPPATPRNTMSKLLKAQALTRRDPHPPPPAHPLPPHHSADTTADTSVDTPIAANTADGESDSKEGRSPDARTTLLASQKLIAQLSSSTSIIATGSWSGAYAAEFGIRPEFPH